MAMHSADGTRPDGDDEVVGRNITHISHRVMLIRRGKGHGTRAEARALSIYRELEGALAD
jgi:hypothetical protein